MGGEKKKKIPELPSLSVMHHVCVLQSMENLYTGTGPGTEGGHFRSDLQDMGKHRVVLHEVIVDSQFFLYQFCYIFFDIF